MTTKQAKSKKPALAVVPPVKKAKKPTVLEIMDLIVKAVVELYPHDTSRPGLVFAYLPSENAGQAGEFYGSIVRYEDNMGEGKKVLVSIKSPNIADCIMGLANALQASTPNTQKLRQHVKRNFRFWREEDIEQNWLGQD